MSLNLILSDKIDADVSEITKLRLVRSYSFDIHSVYANRARSIHVY